MWLFFPRLCRSIVFSSNVALANNDNLVVTTVNLISRKEGVERALARLDNYNVGREQAVDTAREVVTYYNGVYTKTLSYTGRVNTDVLETLVENVKEVLAQCHNNTVPATDVNDLVPLLESVDNAASDFQTAVNAWNQVNPSQRDKPHGGWPLGSQAAFSKIITKAYYNGATKVGHRFLVTSRKRKARDE